MSTETSWDMGSSPGAPCFRVKRVKRVYMEEGNRWLGGELEVVPYFTQGSGLGGPSLEGLQLGWVPV